MIWLETMFGLIRPASSRPRKSRIAAAALITAIHVAAWYSLAHAVVVYPSYYDTARYYQIQPGTQVYIIQRTADGRWMQIRTPNGQVGWVRYDALSGHVRSR